MEELVYTSAPQGLMPGSSGFCTVEMTDGMPTETMDTLESLSAYDQNASGTINWMHLRIQTIRGSRHVLSRVSPMRGEFSGRSNKLASHVCLAPNELPVQGPMMLLGNGGPLRSDWSGKVAKLPASSSPGRLRTPSMPRVCASWSAASGDAGLAGVVLGRLQKSPGRPLYVIRTAAMDALAMTDEMLALMPGADRWSFTFATYAHSMPQSIDCQLRWVLDDSPLCEQVQRMGSDVMIDLRRGGAEILAGAGNEFHALVDAARRGTVVGRSVRAASSPSGSPKPAAPAPRQASMDSQTSGVDFGSPTSVATALPPPPPTNDSASMVTWAMIGTVSLMIPLCGLIIYLAAREPEPVAAVRNYEIEQEKSVQPDVPPPVEKVEVETPRKPRKDRPKPDKPPEKKSPPKKEPEKPKAPPKPVTASEKLRLPRATFGLDHDWQAIHQADNVNRIDLIRVAESADPSEYTVSTPDASGFYDIVWKDTAGEPSILASVETEEDQVRFAWIEKNENRARAFTLAHAMLIVDDVAETTLMFDVDAPVLYDAPPVPTRPKDYEMPVWLSREYPMTMKVTYSSEFFKKPVVLNDVAALPRGNEVKPKSAKVRIEQVNDPLIKEAEFFVAAETIGPVGDWKLVFQSNLMLKCGKQDQPWQNVRDVIDEHTSKHNKGQQGKKQTERRLLNASDRREAIAKWKASIRCEIEFYATVGERKILWGRAVDPQTQADSGADVGKASGNENQVGAGQ
ncbi:hypothetical protein Poly51_03300 [Rubripirellula tenax]|uniref:Uncharacterized protein n=1 Tax=Rubripirellula tenax TaxID=2528015 RepID=A0A5C6FE23_9BACT|nr:hypothetical protein [Rubripirellula tenax]TWU60056.1 hypothetical protein Poly51_03300 [Rubripirellula tenax]